MEVAAAWALLSVGCVSPMIPRDVLLWAKAPHKVCKGSTVSESEGRATLWEVQRPFEHLAGGPSPCQICFSSCKVLDGIHLNDCLPKTLNGNMWDVPEWDRSFKTKTKKWVWHSKRGFSHLLLTYLLTTLTCIWALLNASSGVQAHVCDPDVLGMQRVGLLLCSRANSFQRRKWEKLPIKFNKDNF